MSTAIATHRVTYSEYMTDVTGSPKLLVKPLITGNTQTNNIFLQRQAQGTSQIAGMPHYGGGAEKCARCTKNVYLAEKKIGAGRAFHSSCFSCYTCHRKLDATTLSEHKGEVYCKTCYTRQFGVHGLVSGVTMTTEQVTRDVRHSRRSSYGSDLDAPIITHQTRKRANSNENMLSGEHSAILHDELPKLFPWRNEVLPQGNLSNANKSKTECEKDPSESIQRPKSQIGFERLIDSNPTGERTRHTNETVSAIIEMPTVSPPKINERSPSPSPVAKDIHQRNHTDISDNFSRLTLNEIHDELNKNLYFNDKPKTDEIYSENTAIKRRNSNSSTNDSSPSPTSGYASSNTQGERELRDSTSPPSAFVPQHDYLDIQSSPIGNIIDRQSKSNELPTPSNNDKYPALSALIKPHRPLSQLNSQTDELDN